MLSFNVTVTVCVVLINDVSVGLKDRVFNDDEKVMNDGRALVLTVQTWF